jgi:hypothetical protein
VSEVRRVLGILNLIDKIYYGWIILLEGLNGNTIYLFVGKFYRGIALNAII